MATPILMPTFGMTAGEAIVIQWLKEPGQTVALDEPIFEAETDKATLEVPAPAAGVLLHIAVTAGQPAPFRAVVGWIGQPGEAFAEVANIEPNDPAAEAPPNSSPADQPGEPQPRKTEPGDSWVKASPLARRIAREHGLDLSAIAGTGPGGRVLEADVRRALETPKTAAAAMGGQDRQSTATGEPAATSPAATARKVSPARRLAATRLTESFRSAPHFYLQQEVRAIRLVEMRNDLLSAVERLTGARISFTDLLVKALASVLPDHPLLNATWSDDGIATYAQVDLGVAVATPQGLVVPIIRQAETLSLLAIVRLRADITHRARTGALRPDHLLGGTFTLTNLGMYGIDSFMPILNPPQSAILAAGAIAERPIAHNGSLVLQPTLRLTLAVDHRVADGVQAAIFLSELASLLEAPSSLALDVTGQRS